ncbi:MAG: HAD hydrolase family protein [Alicyclobacillaceae bacterium]|nr:HAD hydrolase family protein [Alicyclobacillaceae bacterium]
MAHVESRAASQVQIVFLDIDGTIVVNRRLIPSAAQAVRMLQARGVQVALCTGRSVLHATPVQQRLRVGLGIYFNGGLVHAYGRTVAQRPLHPAVVRRIWDVFTTAGLPLILHTNGRAFAPCPVPESIRPILEEYDYPAIEVWPQVLSRNAGHQPTVRGRTAFPSDVPVYQANVFMDPSWDALVQNQFPECLLYRWHPQAVDLQKRGCDKSLGALDLLRHLQIPPARALHIGDGGNDIGMFATLGWSVAMGNASPEVQRHAQMVTAPAEEDGVFKALRRIGLI